MKTVTELNDARAQKALDKVFNFDGRVQSLREYLAERNIVAKSVWTEYYSRREICMEKPLLEKPKTTYYLAWPNVDRNSSIDVPKLVYDMYDVPETIHDNEYDKAEWEKEQKRKTQRVSGGYGGPFNPWR